MGVYSPEGIDLVVADQEFHFYSLEEFKNVFLALALRVTSLEEKVEDLKARNKRLVSRLEKAAYQELGAVDDLLPGPGSGYEESEEEVVFIPGEDFSTGGQCSFSYEEQRDPLEVYFFTIAMNHNV